MSKTSIVIPSRNEKFLARTVDDIFAKAAGEIEVIVMLDGPMDYPLPKERQGLRIYRKAKWEGLRPALNEMAELATGKWLCKIDGHEMVSEGFDEVLQTNMDDCDLAVSRYYALDAPEWKIKDQEPMDIYYVSWPPTNSHWFMFLPVPWISRSHRLAHETVSETMGIQASLYMMSKRHYLETMGGMDTRRWGHWSAEPQELSFKTWLSGGRVLVNKNVWNAHWQQEGEDRTQIRPEYTRGGDMRRHRSFAHYWLNDEWPGQTRKMEWLIEHFWPLPLKAGRPHQEKYWYPENWREYWQ